VAFDVLVPRLIVPHLTLCRAPLCALVPFSICLAFFSPLAHTPILPAFLHRLRALVLLLNVPLIISF